MADYARIRDRHRRELEKRRTQAYARIPALQKLEEQTPALAVDQLRRRLRSSAGSSGSGSGAGSIPVAPADRKDQKTSFRETAAQITARRIRLLTENGFPADYLEMKWDCPDCRDTGYIGREKCHCLKQREISVLYNQSRLETLAAGADFSLLSEKYYTGEDLDRFRNALRVCRIFVEQFDTVHRNLYLYGTVGTGKTMLSVCTAKALIEKGRSVLYFSAASLFDRLADCTFSSGSRDGLRGFLDDLYTCDLLIIDDLNRIHQCFRRLSALTCISERRAQQAFHDHIHKPFSGTQAHIRTVSFRGSRAPMRSTRSPERISGSAAETQPIQLRFIHTCLRAPAHG